MTEDVLKIYMYIQHVQYGHIEKAKSKKKKKPEKKKLKKKTKNKKTWKVSFIPTRFRVASLSISYCPG